MKTEKCEQCSTELEHTTDGGYPFEANQTGRRHSVEVCRNTLRASLSYAIADLAKERERANALASQIEGVERLEEMNEDGYERTITALRAELAECRAACEMRVSEALAAEARAERYETTLREMRSRCVRGAHSDDDRIIDTIDAALAETANKTSEANAQTPAVIEGTQGSGVTSTSTPAGGSEGAGALIHTCNLTATTTDGSVPPACKACQQNYDVGARVMHVCSHGKVSGLGDPCPICFKPLPPLSVSPPTPPATPTPNDDAARAAREFCDGIGCTKVHHLRDVLPEFLRTRDAQAREAGRVEGWTEAVKACAAFIERRWGSHPYAIGLRNLKRPDRAKGG